MFIRSRLAMPVVAWIGCLMIAGPLAADETYDHLMTSPGSVGGSEDDLQGPQWFSERSAIKLALSEAERAGTFAATAEAAGVNSTLATAQLVELTRLAVPNTIVEGVHAGLELFADAAVVVGELAAGDIDLYAFRGGAGDLLNVELMSQALDERYGDDNVFDTFLRLRDATGNLVNYYGGAAVNDDELESFDSIFVDLVLPGDGVYYLEVDSFGNSRGGNYELFFHAFTATAPSAVPEPGTWALVLLAGAGGIVRVRRRAAA